MSKKSFVLYHDTRAAFDALDDASAGELIKAVFAFQAGEEVTLSPAAAPIFAMLKAQFTRDADKYQAICRARAEAGRQGGRQKAANAGFRKEELPNASTCQHKQAQAGNSCQTLANLADSDSDSDSEINKEKPLKGKKEAGTIFDQPSLLPDVAPQPAAAVKSFKHWTEAEFKADVNQYPEFSGLAAEFLNHWTEASASGKMRFQLESTWETRKRLLTWKRNAEKWGNGKPGNGQQQKDYTGI